MKNGITLKKICIAKTAQNSLKLENNNPENNYISYKTESARKEFIDRNKNKNCVDAKQSKFKISSINFLYKNNADNAPYNKYYK